MRIRRRDICLGSHKIHKRRNKRRGATFPLLPGFPGELIYTPEIVAVSFDFQRVIRETFTHSETLLQMGSREFEQLVAEIWKRFGYEVELTKATRDGGYDVIAVRHGADFASRILIECKRYALRNPVGVSIVRELYGVKSHRKATKAILATTSYLTDDAEEFIDDHYWELEAKEHDGIVEWVKLAAGYQGTLSVATTAPILYKPQSPHLGELTRVARPISEASSCEETRARRSPGRSRLCLRSPSRRSARGAARHKGPAPRKYSAAPLAPLATMKQ